MARKEVTVELQDDGNNMTFRVRQMSVSTRIGFGIRAMIEMARSGVEFPDGMGFDEAIPYLASSGLPAITKMVGGLEYERVHPLLNELLACCSRVIGNHTQVCTPETIDDYLCESGTLIALYAEAFKINFMKPGLPAEKG